MARSLGYTDTEGAIKWAQSINDEEQRKQAVDSVIRKTFRRNPDGAAAELATLGINQTDIDQAHANSGNVVFGSSDNNSVQFLQATGGGTGAPLPAPASVEIRSSTAVAGASFGVSGTAAGGLPALPGGVGGGGGIILAPPSPARGPSRVSYDFMRVMNNEVE
jgi:hypothetical protein